MADEQPGKFSIPTWVFAGAGVGTIAVGFVGYLIVRGIISNAAQDYIGLPARMGDVEQALEDCVDLPKRVRALESGHEKLDVDLPERVRKLEGGHEKLNDFMVEKKAEDKAAKDAAALQAQMDERRAFQKERALADQRRDERFERLLQVLSRGLGLKPKGDEE